MNDHRLKNLRVPYHIVLDLLSKPTLGVHIRYLITELLPDDAMVLGVHTDPYTRCFVFTLAHESFPNVPEGEVLPFFDAVLNLERGSNEDMPVIIAGQKEGAI